MQDCSCCWATPLIIPHSTQPLQPLLVAFVGGDNVVYSAYAKPGPSAPVSGMRTVKQALHDA
jgi:hypothetical protein